MIGVLRPVPARALLIGIATGMRATTPAAVLAWHHDDAPRYARWRRWPVLRTAWGRRALMAASIGEYIADKAPEAPPRTDPGPLIGRILFGGIAGAAIGSERRGTGPIIRCAVLGGIGGAAGSFGGMWARTSVTGVTGLPDPAIAVVEDIAAVSMAHRAITKR